MPAFPARAAPFLPSIFAVCLSLKALAQIATNVEVSSLSANVKDSDRLTE